VEDVVPHAAATGEIAGSTACGTPDADADDVIDDVDRVQAARADAAAPAAPRRKERRLSASSIFIS
jgi:hypothetical protein